MERNLWTGIEFRHLAALVAIAEEGSFRAAGERLGYVQSAISQQLAFLERTLGIRLIERGPGTGPVALTPPGELLLRHFEEILARLSAARADVDALADGRAGMVRLGVSPNLEARFVPALLRQLGDALRIVVTPATDEAACGAVAGNRLDAALVSAPPDDGPFARRPLLEDPIVLLVRADRPADPGPLIVRHLARDTETATVTGPIAHATDDDATAHALVADGLGAALLPALSVDWEDRAVTALGFEPAPPPRVVSLVWHAERELTPTLETFLRATVAAAQQLQRELAERLDHGESPMRAFSSGVAFQYP
jgi:DNA-binding transcriptional LysR family regulator